jgi:hypothetical protein
VTPNISDWTIVIVGSWNVAILNPDWVAQEVFEQNQISVEVLFGPGQAGFKLCSEFVQLIPSPDRIILSATSADGIENAERAATRLLERLPVTPVTSIGVNFGFLEPEPGSDLLSLFDLKDKGPISDGGWAIQETSILRALKLDDRTLNLRLTHGNHGVSFHLNFHWNVRSTAEAKTTIEGKVTSLRHEAASILKNIYNLEEDGMANDA